MTPIPEMPFGLRWEEWVVRSVANAAHAEAQGFPRLAEEAGIRAEVEVFPWEEANALLLRLKVVEVRGAAVLARALQFGFYMNFAYNGPCHVPRRGGALPRPLPTRARAGTCPALDPSFFG